MLLLSYLFQLQFSLQETGGDAAHRQPQAAGTRVAVQQAQAAAVAAAKVAAAAAAAAAASNQRGMYILRPHSQGGQ